MSPNDSFVAKYTVCTGKREWGWQATWHGWRRLIMLGLSINVLAPAATVFVCGWQIHVGRLLVWVKKEWTSFVDEMKPPEEKDK